ncbi:MAG: DUF6232 family protein [Chloroflexota bacterium]|nr:DUF6232 family protein [Chloroflexota bacterium]
MLESAYFRDNRALVTPGTVELDGQTYSVANIRTATVEQIDKPSFDWLRKARVVAAVIFVIALCQRLLFAYFEWSLDGLDRIIGPLYYLALASVLFATLTLDMLGKLYLVALEGTFGTITALPSSNKRYVVKVARAIRQAVHETQEQAGASRLGSAETGL